MSHFLPIDLDSQETKSFYQKHLPWASAFDIGFDRTTYFEQNLKVTEV